MDKNIKRYDLDYNGEKVGMFERKDGIFVLYSDIKELEKERDELYAKLKKKHEAATSLKKLSEEIEQSCRDLSLELEEATGLIGKFAVAAMQQDIYALEQLYHTLSIDFSGNGNPKLESNALNKARGEE